jgi:Leucine Rich repeat
MGKLIPLLLVLPTVSAAPALRPTEREDQEAAVAAVKRLGGTVMYDYQRPDPTKPKVFDPKARPKDPDGFHRVILVSLRDTKASDDDLKALAKLPAVENLDLSNTPVSGAGLAQLRELRALRHLYLSNTRMDDAGLEHLAGLTKLQSLLLDGTRVTDRGIKHLAGLTDLDEWLGLDGTGVTDDGLHHLAGLTKLRNLNLSRTQVTPAGAAKLRESLKSADISVGP